MESVTNCNYSEKVGLVEKILVLISILEILPNASSELAKSFPHISGSKSSQNTIQFVTFLFQGLSCCSQRQQVWCKVKLYGVDV
jgi:hypothetical protein